LALNTDFGAVVSPEISAQKNIGMIAGSNQKLFPAKVLFLPRFAEPSADPLRTIA
jgi:hypothetical protein